MKRIIHVKAQGVDVEKMFAEPPVRDAQLMACLAYLVAASKDSGVVTSTEMAKAYNVSDFTVVRWVRELSKARALVVEGVSIDGQIRVRVTENGGREAVVGSLAIGGTDDGLSKIAQDPPPPPATPTHPQENNNTSYKLMLSITQEARLKGAIAAYEDCPNIRARQKDEAVKKMLTSVVANPMFDGLDLPKLLMDADATLARYTYKDMVKYLMNWLRKEAKKRKPLNNTNAVPKGKYDTIQRNARKAA